MRLFLLLSLLSFPAFAINWFDMESGVTYKIQQNLSLPQKIESGSILEIQRDEDFTLKGIIGLGMGLGLFNFNYNNCPGPQMETEVEVIPVEGSPTEIGAMVAEGCELWIYVELKDFWTKSIFE